MQTIIVEATVFSEDAWEYRLGFMHTVIFGHQAPRYTYPGLSRLKIKLDSHKGPRGLNS
jgi:hypothetical protein